MSGDAFKFALMILAACAAGAAYSFWYAYRSWAKHRVIEDTPTSRVRSAAQGYVELCGRALAAANNPPSAPLTGMPCTWWHYTIEERGLGRRRWSTVDSGTSEQPFLLDDGTGRCLVDPRGAEVFPDAATVWYGSEDWPQGRIPAGSGAFGWLIDRLFTGRYRYTEQRLRPNDRLYAIGEFRSVGGIGDESTDEAAARLLHQWKRDQTGLLARFDADHDGRLGTAEWDRARAAAQAAALESRCATPPAPAVHVLADPMDGRAFLLAASDRETLARRFRRNALAGLLGFVGSCAALAWMLSHV